MRAKLASLLCVAMLVAGLAISIAGDAHADPYSCILEESPLVCLANLGNEENLFVIVGGSPDDNFETYTLLVGLLCTEGENETVFGLVLNDPVTPVLEIPVPVALDCPTWRF